MPTLTSICRKVNESFPESQVYLIQRAVFYSKMKFLPFSGAKMSFLSGNDGDSPVVFFQRLFMVKSQTGNLLSVSSFVFLVGWGDW